MTLILSIVDEDGAIIVNDTLLSTVKGNPSLELPTIRTSHAYLPAENGFKAHNLMVKTVRITDNAIGTFAGPLQPALNIFKGLQMWAEKNRVSGNGILEETRRLAFPHPDLSFIFHISTGPRLERVSYQCHTSEVYKVGTVLYAGTGSRRCRRFLESYSVPQLFRPGPSRGIVCALSMTGYFLGLELTSAKPLMESFGGLYDIAIQTADKFSSLEDYSFIFWRMGNNAQTPHVIVKTIARIRGWPISFQVSDWHGERIYAQQIYRFGERLVSGTATPPIGTLWQVHIALPPDSMSEVPPMVVVDCQRDPSRHAIYVWESTSGTLARINYGMGIQGQRFYEHALKFKGISDLSG